MTISWPRVIHQVSCLREEHTSAQSSLAAALAELAASSEKETEHYDIAQVYATPLCDFRHSERFSVCVRVFGSSRWRTGDHVLCCVFWGLQLLTLNLWYCFHTPASNSGSFSSSPGFGQCAGENMEKRDLLYDKRDLLYDKGQSLLPDRSSGPCLNLGHPGTLRFT